MTFFTADTHLGHGNIIKYCDRPFKSLDKMNSTIINNWNSRVKQTDTVIVNGDFCFKNTSNRGEGINKHWFWWADQLNGNKVFIEGNHDKHNGKFTHIKSLVLNLNKRDIFITHRPSDILLGYDLYLTGHVHNNWKHKIITDERKHILINIGVDVWNFMPVKLDEILHYIRKNID